MPMDAAAALHVRRDQRRRIRRARSQMADTARSSSARAFLVSPSCCATRCAIARAESSALAGIGRANAGRRERLARGDPLEHDLAATSDCARHHRGERLERVAARQLVEWPRVVPHPAADHRLAVGLAVAVDGERSARTEIEVVEVPPAASVERHRRDLALDASSRRGAGADRSGRRTGGTPRSACSRGWSRAPPRPSRRSCHSLP